MANRPITEEEYINCKRVIAAYRNILEPEDCFRRYAKNDERTVVADLGEIGFLISFVVNDEACLYSDRLIKSANDLFEYLWEIFQNNYYRYHSEYDPNVYIPYGTWVITLPDELEEKLTLIKKKFENAAFKVEKGTKPEELERMVLSLFKYNKLTEEAKKSIATWSEQNVTTARVAECYGMMLKNSSKPNFSYLSKCVLSKNQS